MCRTDQSSLGVQAFLKVRNDTRFHAVRAPRTTSSAKVPMQQAYYVLTLTQIVALPILVFNGRVEAREKSLPRHPDAWRPWSDARLHLAIADALQTR